MADYVFCRSITNRCPQPAAFFVDTSHRYVVCEKHLGTLSSKLLAAGARELRVSFRKAARQQDEEAQG